MSISDPLQADPLTPSGGGTSVLERAEQLQDVEPGDHERFAHYVRKEKILESALSGEPVIALCGKVWIPGRDPQRFPVCPTCKEIYEVLRAEDPGSSGQGSSGQGSSGGQGGS